MAADASLDGFPYAAADGPHLCGPTALAQVLEFQGIGPGRDELERIWGFRRGSDRSDTPGHHFRALGRLGVPFAVRQRVSLEMIASAVGAGRPVVGLLTVGTMLRHWVVVTGVSSGGVTVAWGDSKQPRVLAREEFAKARSGGMLDVLMGTVRLAYVVGEAPPAPWRSSRLLELYFRLQRPFAEHLAVPFAEACLRGIRRPPASGS